MTDYPKTPARDVPYMLALTQKLHNARIITSCLTCVHFIEVTEVCDLTEGPGWTEGIRPPAHVIAYGCQRWFDVV